MVRKTDRNEEQMTMDTFRKSIADGSAEACRAGSQSCARAQGACRRSQVRRVCRRRRKAWRLRQRRRLARRTNGQRCGSDPRAVGKRRHARSNGQWRRRAARSDHYRRRPPWWCSRRCNTSRWSSRRRAPRRRSLCRTPWSERRRKSLAHQVRCRTQRQL